MKRTGLRDLRILSETHRVFWVFGFLFLFHFAFYSSQFGFAAQFAVQDNRAIETASQPVSTGLSSSDVFISSQLSTWIDSQTGRSVNGMLDNISRPDTAKGTVVASPSKIVPPYYYHWVRDGALTMNAIVSLYESTSDNWARYRYYSILMDYITLSRKQQLSDNWSGAPENTGLGEPKFQVDGSTFNMDWGRPQNDGPALRAITLIRFARDLLSDGKWDFVRSLYDSKIPTASLIKADLEYVSYHWRDSSYDLWEEVRGKHFYTKIVQRRALLSGADLADQLGDFGAASWYRNQAAQLSGEIDWHWDDFHGYIVETLDRVGGRSDKYSNLDSGVILGVLHAAGSDSFYGATNDRVLATASRLADTFKSIYGINWRDRDFDNAKMGIAIGRYPEDIYCGYNCKPPGNPWVLLTAAFAELHFRAVKDWQHDRQIHISYRNIGFFNYALSGTGISLNQGDTIFDWDPRFGPILAAVHDTGESFLRRIKFHTPADGSLWEQMNRDTGFMTSAPDLTWSYASFLTASWQR